MVDKGGRGKAGEGKEQGGETRALQIGVEVHHKLKVGTAGLGVTMRDYAERAIMEKLVRDGKEFRRAVDAL